VVSQRFTGRDNIFLSGTLLGFKEKELEKEFNEIVAFCGIEKFINTP
jgi:lipopolysaccharide transport system ATP-binding protein